MGFLEAIRSCLQNNYAGFRGRAPRSEFWFFVLFYLAAMFVSITTGSFVGIALEILTSNRRMFAIAIGISFLLGFICLVLPLCAVGARRLHDLNRSGWWLLFWSIPGLNSFLLLALCLPGSYGGNRFGADPIPAPPRPARGKVFDM